MADRPTVDLAQLENVLKNPPPPRDSIVGRKSVSPSLESARVQLNAALMNVHQSSGRSANDWSSDDQRIMDAVNAWAIALHSSSPAH
jgi:hypothetical protein